MIAKHNVKQGLHSVSEEEEGFILKWSKDENLEWNWSTGIDGGLSEFILYDNPNFKQAAEEMEGMTVSALPVASVADQKSVVCASNSSPATEEISPSIPNLRIPLQVPDSPDYDHVCLRDITDIYANTKEVVLDVDKDELMILESDEPTYYLEAATESACIPSRERETLACVSTGRYPNPRRSSTRIKGLLLWIQLFSSSSSHKEPSSSSPSQSTQPLPKIYPVTGSTPAFLNQEDLLRWTSDILQSSTSSTYVLHLPFDGRNIYTANPENVEHMPKSHLANYPKGHQINSSLRDLLDHRIFAVDGQQWKFQRQIASRVFNTKSLRNFVEQVVDTKLSSCLIPTLEAISRNQTVLDLQDILKRFAFDNIRRFSFGYDPEFLAASLPQSPFALAFEQATMISGERIRTFFNIIWKLKRAFGIASKKQLKMENGCSRGEGICLKHLNSFILAGRDTTSAALTWFFWLLSKNPDMEAEIVKEIARINNDGHSQSVFEEAKEMEYTHAAICQNMRLYPPVPTDTKEAAGDDKLPDGTEVNKGMKVTYHVYAMGRSEKIWGKDWAVYKPERWLAEAADGKKKFVARDPYSYPVFQAWPRVCLGKEMASLQMKRIVAEVLGRFRVVPQLEDGFEPVFVHGLMW
ncbi:Cytochrome P450 94A2-like protein [Drosera capensis]